MLIPIRCFNCGKPLSYLFTAYKKLKKNQNTKTISDSALLNILGITKECCRKDIITTCILIEDISTQKVT